VETSPARQTVRIGWDTSEKSNSARTLQIRLCNELKGNT